MLCLYKIDFFIFTCPKGVQYLHSTTHLIFTLNESVLKKISFYIRFPPPYKEVNHCKLFSDLNHCHVL